MWSHAFDEFITKKKLFGDLWSYILKHHRDTSKFACRGIYNKEGFTKMPFDLKLNVKDFLKRKSRK